MENPTPEQNWRGPIELAVAVSVFAVAAALTLSWFAGLSDSWIVVGTIVGASIVGWRQPAARPTLQPLRVRSERSRIG